MEVKMSNKKVAWTVMVYLAGDNNLTSECLFALTEMKKADPGEQINVIAQFDALDERVPTHRYEINRNGPNSTLFEDIIDEGRYDSTTREVRFRSESVEAKSLALARLRNRQRVETVLDDRSELTTLQFETETVTDDTDTGSPVTLYNFLSFCVNHYPAEHYMVVLSGHAGGTESDYLMKDESSKGALTFNEMKLVFRELQSDLNGQPIDIIGMDNCLMSMAEICYELRGVAEIVVGCESYSPASGWPYRQILERLRSDLRKRKKRGKSSLPFDAAKGIVDEYVNYYSDYWLAGVSVSQSALHITKIEKFRHLLDRLAAELETRLISEHETAQKKSDKRSATPFKDALVLAHWEAQSYNGESFVDLYDFCDCLEKRLPASAVTKRCGELKRFIASEFVLRSCFSGPKYQFSYGISVYFPWSHVADTYWNLDFIRASAGLGWGRFIYVYTLLTRREPRTSKKNRMLKDMQKSMIAQLAADRMAADRMAADRMAADRMAADRMAADRMAADRMAADRMAANRMAADRMAADRMAADRMAADRMAADRMAADRMMTLGLGNPIYSMRNPPVVFFPMTCLKQRSQIIAAQKRFLRIGRNQ
jgi:Clostripain family